MSKNLFYRSRNLNFATSCCFFLILENVFCVAIMKKPEVPFNENQRLASLNRLDFQSLEHLEEFDFLTSLAADVCGCEISLISLIYADKQWFLSNHGLEVKETPRDYAFCAHAIHDPNETFTVENALEDLRFHDNPLVIGDPQIRFYAGIPILDRAGIALGTLCVIDPKPKKLKENQVKTLKNLANQVQRLFELRQMRLDELETLRASEMNLTLLQDSQEFNRIGAWQLDLSTHTVTWTEMIHEIHEVDLSFQPTLDNGLNFYHPKDLPLIANSIDKCINKGAAFSVECRLITASGRLIWVRSSGKRSGNRIIGSFQDITPIKESELKFKMMINSSSSLLVVFNPKGKIVELNDAALELSGMARNQFIGQHFLDCNYWDVSSEALGDLIRKFEQAIQGEESSEELVIWLNAEIPFTVMFSVKPIFDEFGPVVFVVAEAMPIQDVVDARNRYKFVLEGAHVATGQWNLAYDEIIFDERWPALLGYTLADLGPMTTEKWLSFFHPEDRTHCEKMLDKVFKKELTIFDVEARTRHKDGRWLWLHNIGQVLQWSQDNKPLVMYSVHSDITERKERELKLAYQENILNALFQNSPIGIVLNDFESGEFLDVNRALLDNLQYQKDEFINLDYRKLTTEDVFPWELEKSKISKEKGDYGPLEKRYHRKDGSSFTAVHRGFLINDAHGRHLVWSFVQDISKEKAAEKHLRDALLRLQTVLNTSTNVAFISTDTEGTIELFNTGAEKLLGYSAADVVGKNTPYIFHDSAEVEERSAHLLQRYGKEIHGFDVFTYKANQGGIDTRPWTYIRKDSSKIKVLLSIAAIKEGDTIVGYLGAATDITELQKNEEEIKDLLALTQNQNERLENFARIVSHNLKNHSDGILGILELLREKNPELATNKFLSLFEKSAKNLVSTIGYLTEERLLKSKLSALHLEQVNLRLIVQKNLTNLQAQILHSGMSIEINIDLETTVLGVPAYIDSAVLNLISNAIKYRDIHKTSVLKISASNQEGCIALAFVDNGLGIDLEKHGNEVFSLNKTFHNNVDSRGIGLFITKNQMEQMGGKIEVKSTPHVGSTFTLYFPAP